ncbi:MAG: hypothetical protein IJ498_03315 [Akkermansia sp.]|nr:hypothetical protein [Akkermansia sp.]
MKRPLSIFALLALSSAVLQAAPMYTIHLSNSERFTECTVVYQSDTTTKFRGKNRDGKLVTKEIPSTSILAMREIEVQQQAKEKEEPTAVPQAEDKPAEQAQADTTAQPTGSEEKPEGEQPSGSEEKTSTEADGEATPQPAPTGPEFEDANLKQTSGEDKAKDVTLRLREKVQRIDNELSGIQKPSRTLTSICNNTKARVNQQLEEMDKLSLQVAEQQVKFNAAGVADYQFSVLPEDRDKFLRDATAAYNAMLIDMKEKKSRRKVGGLDKFEILFERYQGAPEYKQAHEWYLQTLKDLQKRWSRMQAAEKKKRSKLPAQRAEAMASSDNEEFEKMEAYFKRNGEEVAKVWYTPSTRNMKMLTNCINKVNDTLRRNEYTKLSEEAGCVPELLNRFWTTMDNARNQLVCGNLDAAEKMLRDDESLQTISSLRANTMPQEYRKPMLDENRALMNEIRKRTRDIRSLQHALERSTNQLNRAVSSAEAQINNALDAIEREKAMLTEDQSIEIVNEEEEKKKEEAAKKAAEQKQPQPAPAAK